ncbi:MAG TPA: DUF559 domain-containing protein [Acidimicrobiales bacterium]
MTSTSTLKVRGAEAALGLLAARQCGAFSRSQALALGVSDSTMQRRVTKEIWERSHPGVYIIAGAERSWLQCVWCAYLAVGPSAVVTHESALHLHDVHLVSRWPITLTVAHGGHARLDRVFVHQIDDLKPHRVTTIFDLPVCTAERAVIELAATVGEEHLSRVADEVIATRKTTLARTAACFREVLRPGKPGMAKLARVLDTRGAGYVPPESELERVLFAALAAGGLPEPRRQFPLPGRRDLRGLVDAAYPDGKLLIEADGRRWHTRIEDLKRDHERDTEAARRGWLTLRFVYEQIVHSPGEVCAAIADVLVVRSPEVMVPTIERLRR